MPMSRIKVLDAALVNKISAGEVIERPASVVRELLENSIDSGATSIEVDVEGGGVKLIRVADDGMGMDPTDAELCLRSHATSKLDTVEDLFNLSSMGFRGEALPSIASVSRFSLTTARRGEAAGLSLEVKGGEVLGKREAPSVGTVVEVRDLFFNTPARRKFLKRQSTELAHIVDAVTRLGLTHPALRFVLRVGGTETVNLPRAGDRAERLRQLYGGEFVDGLAAVWREAPGLELEAFVSKPGNFRSTRSHQMVFVNRRPVREPSVNHALYSALEGFQPRDAHPIFFIYLDADPRLVDLNVHPAKREVRFQDKEGVYRLVKRGVMDAIRAENAGQDTGATAGDAAAGVYAPPTAGTGAMSVHQEAAGRFELGLMAGLPSVYLGETFVALAARDGGVVLMDHHAAHERVLYERFLKGLRLRGAGLLFPRQVRLGPKEHMAVLEHAGMLAEFGIELEDFGGGSVIVRSVPPEIMDADLEGILSDAANQMLSGEQPGRTLRESVAARIACHASVRGTKVLGPEQLAALLDDLDAADDPEHCPHGRPTRVVFDMDRLKKLFGRK